MEADGALSNSARGLEPISSCAALMPLALHPSVRGLVSALGVLDIFVALGLLQSRPETPNAAPR